METKTYCAYNASRGRHLSPQVTVVERTDQPLTIMRLLVESLGIKAETSLWLNPLHGTPQLVRPFPFDLVYLDKDLRVMRCAELLPEVPFPVMDAEVTSALALPLRTLSSTGTQEGDRLIVCASNELEPQLKEISSATSAEPAPSKTDESTGDVSIPVEAKQESTPAPEAEPLVFASTKAPVVLKGAGFTVALTTSWQIRNSTTTAVAPGIETGEQALSRDVKVAAETETKPAEVSATETETISIIEAPESSPAAESENAPTEVAVETAESAPATEPETISIVEVPDSKSAESAPAEVASISATETETAAVEATESAPAAHSETASAEQVEGPSSAAEIETISVETADNASAAAEVTEKASAEAKEGAVAQQEAPAATVPAPEKPAEVRAAKSASEQAPVPTHGVVATPAVALEVEPAKAAPEAATARSKKPKEAQSSKRKKAQTPAAVQTEKAAAPKKRSREKKPEETTQEEPLGARVMRWLHLEGPLPERRAARRYLMPGLTACDAAAGDAKSYEVRDVSPTGLFLKNAKRWRRGDMASLILRNDDAKGANAAIRVDVLAGAVRSDEGGVALSFVLPEGVAFEPWQRLHTKKSSETDATYFVRELRLARALGFLQRVCPPAAQQIRLTLHENLSNKRVANAVDIALRSEEILSRSENGSGVVAHPQVVTRILDDGSWADDDWVRQMWAGLLATSCTPDGQDTSNIVFVDLLDKLTPVHLRVLTFACRKGTEMVLSGESLAKVTLYCTGDELIEAAGSHNLARIQQTIGHLSSFGLLAESGRPSYVGAMEKVKTKTTPTALGMKMHARCTGQR